MSKLETTTAEVSTSAWNGLGNYLNRTDASLIGGETRKTLLDQWQDINRQEDHLDDALMIGLVGGTGVGKSTFINAMAGTEISRSSDRRPTTSRVVVYRHVDTEIPAEVPNADLSQPQALHRNDQLSKVILFDFPDFDSAEESHADIIQRYLPHLDVLLIVVDDVKYGDRRLYELLDRLDHSALNLFVIFNKVDRLRQRYGDRTAQIVQEVLADLRQKLADNANITMTPERQFSVSARSAMESREAGKPTGEDFEEVESMVSEYQHDKYRRAAKERNIDSRKRQLVSEISSTALGDDNREILDETQTLVTEWRGELGRAMDRISVELLSEPERRSLRRAQLRRVGPDWGFPFSLFFTLLGELRRRKYRKLTTDATELGQRINQHYRAFLEALTNLRARVSTEFSGFANHAAGKNLPAIAAVGEMESLTTKMASGFQATINRDVKPPSRFKKLMAHFPALFVLGFSVWKLIFPLLNDLSFGNLLGILGVLNPTFIIGTILSILFAYLCTAGFLWLRTAQKFDQQLMNSEKEIRAEISEHGKHFVSELEEHVKTMHTEFATLAKTLGK